MRPVYLSLASRALLSQAMLLVVFATLATAAALVDGHPPSLEALSRFAPSLASFLGTGWTLATFRAQANDVAFEALGYPARRAYLWLALLGTPLLVLASPREPPPATLSFHADGVTQRGALAISWRGDLATRLDNGLGFEGFPRPTPPPPQRATKGLGLCFNAVALLALVVSLARKTRPPQLPLTVLSALSAFAASQAALALST